MNLRPGCRTTIGRHPAHPFAMAPGGQARLGPREIVGTRRQGKGATEKMTERQHRNTVVKYTLDPSVAARVVALMRAGPRELVPTGPETLCVLRFAAACFQFPTACGCRCRSSRATGTWARPPYTTGSGRSVEPWSQTPEGTCARLLPFHLFLRPFDLRIPTAAVHSPVAFAHNRSVRWQSRNDQAAIKEYLDKEWHR